MFVPAFGQACGMPTTPRVQPRTVVTVAAALGWLVLGIAAPWHGAGDPHSRAVALTIVVWGWALWTAGAVALLVPSPVSLTTLHGAAPLLLACAAVAASPAGIFGAILACIVVFSSLFADTMVQGSAYGDETRFALRTPVPAMAPAVVAWAAQSATLIGGSLLLASRQWVAGAVVVALGLVLARTVPQRLHRLARRWLVIVPAGIVVHDHTVLGETFMVPTSKLRDVRTVAATGQAADLTGGVLGPRIEIAMADADKVVLSRPTARLLGTTEALHVLSFTFAPRRPAAAVAAIRR